MIEGNEVGRRASQKGGTMLHAIEGDKIAEEGDAVEGVTP
tara:strand:- start:139 stop:258 length:120 start_codon:yes stop_codon:yes gene_type:complete